MVKKEKTPSSIYLMHKYWGKKPPKELKEQVLTYTKKGDLILDPFAGYGGIGIEAVIAGRNVILNDLNPAANFISNCILEQDIDLIKLDNLYKELTEKYSTMKNTWYSFKGHEIITILRDKNDKILKLKIKNDNNKYEDIDLTKDDIVKLLRQEENYKITTWYPTDKLIKNSRICSNGNLRVCDLFPKRALICQSYLLDLINHLEESNEKKLLLLAFTSNIANCSKLVPPISSRGDMAQGAWMTGFYVGETYLENNVFHYFENRVKKIIKGKKDFLENVNKKSLYNITSFDAKHLKIDDNSIDFVFTDFPYGDTVPYFEQSQIWNMWLKNKVDYENEIVVSDSKQRNKNQSNFAKDIDQAILEISRVLKNNKYFTFTFHSLNGEEWEAITNSIFKYPFEFVDFKLLLQKTLTPRQINRKHSIKGDLVVTYKKVKHKQLTLDYASLQDKIEYEIKQYCQINKDYDTNELIILFVKCLLKFGNSTKKIDFTNLINEYFILNEDSNKWILKNKME